MAVYKVPQDVEAEDKLLGPLTFRQFIYAIVSIAAIALAFFMFQVFPPLALVPLPVAILFAIVALPLRKDQPMETYLLAILRFYLKPKQRLWNPDGTITYVEITVPKAVEQRLAKDLTGEAAKERLDYLARVMDSRGWALKGVTEQNDKVSDDVVAEAQGAVDVLDEDAALSKSFESLIAKKDQERRQEVMEQMQQQAQQPAATPAATAVATPVAVTLSSAPELPKSVWSPSLPATAAAQQDDDEDDEDIKVNYNPYPSAMHQKVVHPLDDTHAMSAKSGKKPLAKSAKTKDNHKAKQAAAPPIPDEVSPAIIRLANNGDLSISAIAHEAHRIEGKLDQDEVVINLH